MPGFSVAAMPEVFVSDAEFSKAVSGVVTCGGLFASRTSAYTSNFSASKANG